MMDQLKVAFSWPDSLIRRSLDEAQFGINVQKTEFILR